jgi:hypothetical protein
MSTNNGWWNRNEGKPNGPAVSWLVWIAIAAVILYGLYVSATGGNDQPGPDDPQHSLPARPAMIMPVNSWS